MMFYLTSEKWPKNLGTAQVLVKNEKSYHVKIAIKKKSYIGLIPLPYEVAVDVS